METIPCLSLFADAFSFPFNHTATHSQTNTHTQSCKATRAAQRPRPRARTPKALTRIFDNDKERNTTTKTTLRGSTRHSPNSLYIRSGISWRPRGGDRKLPDDGAMSMTSISTPWLPRTHNNNDKDNNYQQAGRIDIQRITAEGGNAGGDAQLQLQLKNASAIPRRRQRPRVNGHHATSVSDTRQPKDSNAGQQP